MFGFDILMDSWAEENGLVLNIFNMLHLDQWRIQGCWHAWNEE